VLNVRKVVVYELLSLDGVAEKPDGFFADWDDAMEVNLGAVIAAQDSVIPRPAHRRFRKGRGPGHLHGRVGSPIGGRPQFPGRSTRVRVDRRQ